ncbi:MAG: SufD family Fe-S cluster assembly protein [Selenomonadaceae bacterium]|nr:SufD family Fe-S cluster assembly protein [Selenomonadaceae bacterium]
MDENIFSVIPMRTWRWLGVNELKNDATIEERTIDVPDGETQHVVEINDVDNPIAKRIRINVGKGARVEVTAVDINRADSAVELVIDLNGDDSSAEVESVYFGADARKLDLNYVIRQCGRRTDAVMNVRGALAERAEKNFRGTLDFQRGSKGSVGRESEEVVLLSNDVRNRSVPLMLSHEDDVDGHHAVSIGRIDEEKLYYLESRGLDRAQAERLIVEAAFTPVLERIDDEKLRAELNEKLQRLLA